MQNSGDPIRVGLLASAYYMRVGLHSILAEIPGLVIDFEGAALSEMDGKPRFDVLIAVGHSAESADVARFLRDADPGIGILLLLEAPPTPGILDRLRSRPWSILSLEATPAELSAAVRALHAGLWSGDPALLVGLFARSPAVPTVEADAESLTSRELEVLQHLARGQANKQIASALNLSENTVKFHISTIYAKFGVSNRAEAVITGARRGLISL
jgi:DNA-binding NarL/FixJ family response regulator